MRRALPGPLVGGGRKEGRRGITRSLGVSELCRGLLGSKVMERSLCSPLDVPRILHISSRQILTLPLSGAIPSFLQGVKLASGHMCISEGEGLSAFFYIFFLFLPIFMPNSC